MGIHDEYTNDQHNDVLNGETAVELLCAEEAI